jgi:hypothetical protein
VAVHVPHVRDGQVAGVELRLVDEPDQLRALARGTPTWACCRASPSPAPRTSPGASDGCPRWPPPGGPPCCSTGGSSPPCAP